MKKQEVLDYLGLEELPEPTTSSNKKCAALVKRTTGLQDYAICKGGGVVFDSKFRAGIAEIIEFYPELKKEVKPEQIKPEVPETITIPHVQVEKPAPKKPAAKKFVRADAIDTLEKRGLNKNSLVKKNDKQLRELLGTLK